MQQVEAIVNEQIRLNSETVTEIMPIEEAKSKGAAALFGEKYDDVVRVLSMGGQFSVELCGGTHVKRSGDIGLFKITSEGGISAGVRRIEAVTGEAAAAWADEADRKLAQISALLKGSRENVVDKVEDLAERNRQLEKELAQLKSKLAAAQGSDLLSNAVDIKGAKVPGC